MDMFKNSLIAFTVLAVIGISMLAGAFLASLTPTVVAEVDKEKARPRFYLTTTSHNGAQALTACATGFHMASVWEILDPSNLRYDRDLGFTQGDSGYGPPTGFPAYGWIRTGATGPLAST